MTAINYAAIDADYPVAGVDNDSQGFRDNFQAIKDGLSVAESRLEYLDVNTAKKNGGNNFGGNLIDNALVNRIYGQIHTVTNAAGTYTLNLEDGPYQTLTVVGDTTLRLTGWPATGKYASVRMAFKSNGDTHTVTFATIGGGSVVLVGSITNPISTGTDATTLTIVDAWSIDGGSTVYVAKPY